MIARKVKIINKLGLHLRAATKLVQLASTFDADITLHSADQSADAKSIMDVLVLAAIVGTVLRIEVSGPDESEEIEALDQLTALINNRFGEDE